MHVDRMSCQPSMERRRPLSCEPGNDMVIRQVTIRESALVVAGRCDIDAENLVRVATDVDLALGNMTWHQVIVNRVPDTGYRRAWSQQQRMVDVVPCDQAVRSAPIERGRMGIMVTAAEHACLDNAVRVTDRELRKLARTNTAPSAIVAEERLRRDAWAADHHRAIAPCNEALERGETPIGPDGVRREENITNLRRPNCRAICLGHAYISVPFGRGQGDELHRHGRR